MGALVGTDIIRWIRKWSGMPATLGMEVGDLGIGVGGILACILSHFSHVQLWPHGLPGSSVHGISQSRILKWVAITSSGDLPDSGIKSSSPDSPALTGGFFTTGSLGMPGRETYFLPNPHLYSWNVLSVPNSFKIISYTELVAHQAHLSMEFSRQEYWHGLPSSSPRDLPSPGIEPVSPALHADSLPPEPPGKANNVVS